ncbi:MAG: L-threonylcarbamoyladenylate synthase [Bacteroidota bacterium]
MISTDIALAKKYLEDEQVIGLPTETVYGLAGNMYSEKAIGTIYKIKQRPSFNPLIVHLKDITDLEKVAIHIPAKAYQLAQTFWPGPLTLLLPKHPSIPNQITAGKDSVAVRVPNHPVALALLASLDFPLAAPSANPFTRISPTNAEQVEAYFQNEIPLVLQGGSCKNGVESTIIGFDEDRVILYRYGAIPIEAIEAEVGEVHIYIQNEKNPEAPGMLMKHYSPHTPVVISDNIKAEILKHPEKKIGLIVFYQAISSVDINHQQVLSSEGDLQEAAANLYQALHSLDALQLDVIIAEIFPDEGLGKTINDRLRRAAEK